MAEDTPEKKAGMRELREAQRCLRAVRDALSGRPVVPDQPPYCSFCGIGENNVERMFAGVSREDQVSYICGECVEALYKEPGHGAT